jgi:hypothetical protein
MTHSHYLEEMNMLRHSLPKCLIFFLLVSCGNRSEFTESADEAAVESSGGTNGLANDKRSPDSGSSSADSMKRGKMPAEGSASGDATRRSPAPAGEVPADTTPESPKGEKSPETGRNPSEDVFKEGKLPEDCINHQNILVLDLKSGWWGGDGGESFIHILEGMKSACNDKPVSIEYHHILKEHKRKKLYDQASLDRYSQVWLLSGSLADPWDVRIEDPVFQNFLKEVAGTSIQVFVGAGFGSIDHANALLKALLGEAPLTTEQNEGDLLFPAGGFTVDSYITTSGSDLFSGITDSLADNMMMFTSPATVNVNPSYPGSDLPERERSLVQSDIINAESDKIEVLAHCTGGGACIAKAYSDKHNIIIDSGIQRFYVLLEKKEKATHQYVQNVIKMLSAP